MSSKDSRIADLEADLAELHGFNTRSRETAAQHTKILRAIYAEHQPILTQDRDRAFELRCRRCHTDEHHTWHSDNYMPWPCPTVAPFVAYAVYTPREAEQEAAE
ncbi:hypothetical protein [Nocardia sp. NBC_01388]|uniref:hypothetical protein n=1 Tax=Nocardia sp. NBC_01388 TaxID=2903596 RepID=UPI00324C0270